MAVGGVAALFAAASFTNQAGAAPTSSTATSGAPVSSAIGAGTAARTVSVSGKVTLRVVPDRATIRLQTSSTQKTPSDARNKNATTTTKVIKALREAGVPASQISPGLFQLTRNIYDDGTGLRNSDGRYTGDGIPKMSFTASTEIVISLTNIGIASDALGAAFLAGASEGNVEFGTSRLRELRDEARKKAIVAAREKAQLMATAAGISLGRVLSFGEVTGSWHSPSTSNAVQNVVPATDNGTLALGDSFGSGPISIDAEVEIEVLVT